MTLLAEDYFANGKNLFPTAGVTAEHLAQILRSLQKAQYTVGGSATVVTIGAEGKSTNIQSALSGITDNSVSKQYVLLLANETFTEDVTLKPYVHVIGSGKSSTKIVGRVIGPTGGYCLVQGVTINPSLATPAVDIAAGTVVLDVCSIQNDGAGAAIRVTGGRLESWSSVTEKGALVVSGGEAIFYNFEGKLIAGSSVSGGIFKILNGRLTANQSGLIMTISGGIFQTSYLEVENSLGSFFSVAGGTFKYGVLRGSVLTHVIDATAGAIEAGLRNFSNSFISISGTTVTPMLLGLS